MIPVSSHLTPSSAWSVQQTVLFFPTRPPERRLLASGYRQLHAVGKGEENPSDALAHGQAADEVVCLLILH